MKEEKSIRKLIKSFHSKQTSKILFVVIVMRRKKCEKFLFLETI
jgi:hypothetical protein